MEKAVFISPTATKKEILKKAKRNKNTKVFIVANKNKKFLGDVHEDDLFLMVIPNHFYENTGLDLAFDLEKKFFAKTARQIMRKHDVSASPDDNINDIAIKFTNIEVNEMPVINDKGKVIGIVTQAAILRKMKL